MPLKAKYTLLVSMDVAAEHEALFNEVYDEHIGYILKVPGVRHVARLKGEPFTMLIGGEGIAMPAPDPVYTALYEIDDPAVLSSPEWVEACEAGRWATDVRQHTRKRKHVVYRSL